MLVLLLSLTTLRAGAIASAATSPDSWLLLTSRRHKVLDTRSKMEPDRLLLLMSRACSTFLFQGVGMAPVRPQLDSVSVVSESAQAAAQSAGRGPCNHTHNGDTCSDFACHSTQGSRQSLHSKLAES